MTHSITTRRSRHAFGRRARRWEATPLRALRLAVCAGTALLGLAGPAGAGDHGDRKGSWAIMTRPLIPGDPVSALWFDPDFEAKTLTLDPSIRAVAPTCGSDWCAAINFSPTGTLVANFDFDTAFYDTLANFGSIQSSPDGEKIAVGGAGGGSLVELISNFKGDLTPAPVTPPSTSASRATRALAATIQKVPLPGPIQAFTTQAIAFDPMTSRAHVCNTAGVSVIDPPHTAVSFTVPLANCTGVATSPDGSVVAAVKLTNQVFIYTGPLTAASTPQILTLTGSPTARLEGLAFARDGSKIITPALDTPDIFLVSPPYGSASTVKKVSLPGVVGGWEDVAVSPDNSVVVGAGAPNPAGALDPNIPIGRFPFGEGDFTTGSLPGGRGGGAARFIEEPPCTVGGGAGSALAVRREGAPRAAGVSTLFAALLPLSRSVRVGCPATAFLSVINSGIETAIDVSIALATAIPAQFLYQTTDANNALTGAPNTPVSIGPGQTQSFLIAITPTAPFLPTDVAFTIAGTNTDAVAVIPSVNTLKLAAGPGRTGDTIALAATANGIVDIPSPTGIGVFAVATANVGINSIITVSGDTGSAGAAAVTTAAVLPLSITVCQTNPATGECLAPPAASVTTPIAAGATPTFAFFVAANGTVPFDPANNRAFARFLDALGVERGSTSLAVRTQ